MSRDHWHDLNEGRTGLAALLTGGFMLVELVGGLLVGSLALVADSAHMLTDTASLALAWFGFRLARRPANWRKTFGYDRFQILVAFANGIALLFLIAWIAVEAVGRFFDPVEVLGGPMLAIALAGLAVNVAAFAVLHGADRENLNIRGALLHVLGDLLGSVAALVAAAVILTTGWMPIDPLLSILVCLLLLRSAWKLLRDSGHILLEGAPRGVDVREIGPDLVAEIAEVDDVHHVHAWSLTQERKLVSLHARLAPGAHADGVTARIALRLQERFGLGHATVQIEHEACADDEAGGLAGRPRTAVG